MEAKSTVAEKVRDLLRFEINAAKQLGWQHLPLLTHISKSSKLAGKMSLSIDLFPLKYCVIETEQL